MQNKERLGIYAKIAIARKQLDLDEDTYREMLQNDFGKSSAKDLNVHELARLLQKFASLGVSFTHKGTNKKVTPHARPDWIEITDSMSFAKQKREILLIWRKLGYSMSSLDTRIKREFNCHLFVWLDKEADIKKLLCDLQSREKTFLRKQHKAECGANA